MVTDVTYFVSPMVTDVTCFVSPMVTDVTCFVSPMVTDVTCFVSPVVTDVTCFVSPMVTDVTCFVSPMVTDDGAGRSSEVERSLMVRWVVGSILHGVDPLSYFSFQPVLHDWCNKGRDMCYPVCGMVHIKEPLLLIDKSSLCGGSGFPFSLSEWSLTICVTPYNRK